MENSKSVIDKIKHILPDVQLVEICRDGGTLKIVLKENNRMLFIDRSIDSKTRGFAFDKYEDMGDSEKYSDLSLVEVRMVRDFLIDYDKNPRVYSCPNAGIGAAKEDLESFKDAVEKTVELEVGTGSICDTTPRRMILPLKGDRSPEVEALRSLYEAICEKSNGAWYEKENKLNWLNDILIETRAFESRISALLNSTSRDEEA